MVRGDSVKQSSYDASYSHHDTHIYEKPFFQYFIILSIIATLAISIFALANVYQIKKAVVPRTINANDFLKKLMSHAEMKGYVGVAPLNVIQINNNNFANLQAQIRDLDASFIGNFLVQYTDKVVVYDYDNDKIRGTLNLQQPQAQLPADFLTKLNKHAEMAGLQNQQPVGGQLDAASLATLKQQFPDVYANAKVGDFLLRYQTKLIIYDYNADKIVNAVNLA
ncbi:MAG: hypothetical protein HYW23_01190 [Candidatus Aenigmarchaeota archaeon]|nr:hypothetical protein [Candidatus Aenigmarchaeota archaeon]